MIVAAARHAAAPDPATAKVARQFEALFVAQMLKAARAASLGDDLTGQGGATFNDLADQLRAEALAALAPLGVAKLLAK
jgi:flagellar protein FlgJ